MNTAIAIVSPIEVKRYIDDASYVIIDARPHSHYIASHIPGAIWMSWDTWCEEAPMHAKQMLAQAGYWGVVKDSTDASLAAYLEQLGLHSDHPVVVYADGSASKGREARIAWMLLYWGIPSVRLLNGGWSGWLKNSGSIETVTPKPKPGQFTMRLQEHRRVRLAQLKQDYQNNTLPLLIDVRSLLEFQGHQHAYQPRLGRLPGALHLPFTELFDEAGDYITKSAYLERLPPKVRSADRLVAYCEVGVRSCLLALLHEVYTGQVIANFDGSIMEWALDMELPMESGAP
jgi:thiosulfate/3-mercaptopyruvate sulfurtransferase